MVIGRDRDANITIADPMVSRKHCELKLTDHGLRLRDMGSVNATLVNGEPVKTCFIKDGDEITVGQVVFAVAETDESGKLPKRLSSRTTLSLAQGEAVYLEEHIQAKLEEGEIHTVTDVAQLFRYSRTFSRARSLDELFGTLEQAVLDRFVPTHFWLALVGSGGEGWDYRIARAETETDPPDEMVAKALEELRGFLVAERLKQDEQTVLQLTLLAPIYFGSQAIGVLVLRADTATRAYDESDLEYLVALADAVAPFFGAVERREELEHQVRRLRTARQKSLELVGSSKAIEDLRNQISRLAAAPHAALIIGETGAGKEVVAKLIHELSDRAGGPLVTVNCAAIPDDLFESELFGYEKGAFTGANNRKIGLLQQSDGGTVFLDEVGDLSPASQARILRALETKRFRRVGGKEEIQADFRILAATNKDVSDEKQHPEFRRDLYHRLRGIEVRVPPLRERTEDIRELAELFLEAARAHVKHPLRGFSEAALEFLASRQWRGNVRELKHCVEVAATFSKGEFIEPADLRAVAESNETAERPLPLEEVEKRHILKTLDYCGGKVVETAKVLGIGKTTLYERLAEYRKEE